MNALVKKEIRLLLPSWLVVLALAACAPWFLWNDPDTSFVLTPLIVFFGVILMAVDAFGREFSLGTFSNLLAQPVERRRIWRTKITILFSAAALVFLAYFISSEFFLQHALKIPFWAANPKIIGADFRDAMWVSVATILIALTGGLWTTLLLRQIAAAFWITFIAPAGSLLLILFVISKFFSSVSSTAVFTVLASAAILYSLAGFWLAHRLFHRAQDAAWTGGVISFSKWRYFEDASAAAVSSRKKRSLRALFKKEMRLQSISWFCAAAVLVLHAGVIVMRLLHGRFSGSSFAQTASEFFWTVWLILPLIIGSAAVAEERRLGMSENQFCQPASRRVQFSVKFCLAFLAGIFLGGVMPILMEGLAAQLGAPNQGLELHDLGGWVRSLFIFSALAFVLVLTAAYASTLVASFLQAMGLSVVLIIGAVGLVGLIGHARSFLGLSLNPLTVAAVAILTLLFLLPGLTYRNYTRMAEAVRVWRRNLVALAIGAGFVWLGSSALYNRAWEVFEPAEPAHGPAKLSLADKPAVEILPYEALMVRLPSGQCWFDRLATHYYYFFNRALSSVLHPLPASIGPQQFVGGSNWVSVTAGVIGFRVNQKTVPDKRSSIHPITHRDVHYWDVLGIRKDGSLWIAKSDPGRWKVSGLIRLGNETNWKQAVQTYSSVFLLKQDGTLWRCGNTLSLDWRQWPPQWPACWLSELHQVGTNADWSEMSSTLQLFARKADGSTWKAEEDNKGTRFKRDPSMDAADLNTLRVLNNNAAYVRPDGTLWARASLNGRDTLPNFKQVGAETNWVAAAVSYGNLIALNNDGALWVWHLFGRDLSTALDRPPKLLSIHHDWVAITGDWANIITLAADGSLWLWPNQEAYYHSALLKLPKQPKLLANVFDRAD